MKKIFIIFILFYICAADENENCPKIIKRGQWSTANAKINNYLITPVPYVIIHHTATPECNTKLRCAATVDSIRSYHMDILGWSDIGYSFLIGGDGNVYEGCSWDREGAHTYGYNKKSIGIAFIGNFQEKAASDKMLDVAHKLIACGKSKGMLREDVKVYGGRQLIAIESPGFELYGQIQDWPEWSSS